MPISSARAEVPATNTPSILTNAAQVRALTAEEAGRKIPIRLRGVLVEKNNDGSYCLVDGTTGLYVEGSGNAIFNFSRGDLMEVEGVSDPGRFGPFMKAQKLQKVGHTQMPEPLKPSADALLSGCMDAQWIEITGVVRRVIPGWKSISFEVSMDNGGGRLLVSTSDRHTVSVDSRVRLRGVCLYLFNTSRQVIRPYLSIPDGEPIVVIEAGTTNLDALPIRPVQSLLQFSPNQNYAHRVRVRGVVLYSQPGEGFWIRDGSRGLHVYCDSKEPLETGTEVDVFGFLKRGEFLPALEDAVFRKTGRVPPPSPIPLKKASEALDHDCDLVEGEAVILERWSALDGCRLKLSDGTTEYLALLQGENETPITRLWQPGARVHVTGICDIGLPSAPNRPGTWEPQSFQILLRSPADVTILQPPPWWNARHAAWLASGLAAILLLIVAFVIGISRRRLRVKNLERMRSEAEFAAVLNERNRMARELHDTLAQGLSAISMQLEAVKRHLRVEP
ncbi:MAG TPA: histidine kinase dimerization/phosphoacceptor domain-containing protein, partial [Candidatus Binatia bacterium]|nr:histidine kinase dimerization/phosphoacceptor domain-containing protein [Candidatus Binatia bacterium]